MAFINDRVFDNGLSAITSEATRLDLCSQEPTTYTEATSTYTLANKTSISVSSPTDGDSSGRKVVVSAITGGSVTSDGTVTHWAVSDTSNTRLLATGALSASQAVTSGYSFDLAAIDITIPDAA